MVTVVEISRNVQYAMRCMILISKKNMMKNIIDKMIVNIVRNLFLQETSRGMRYVVIRNLNIANIVILMCQYKLILFI